ncbi:hypothetical protein TSUD_230870 [Trifolium subterraneum]|nr:hypothetical protein TSUD_230870 [Trifolium subterraneum]
MVLMDSIGGRIHASIKETPIYKFKNDLIEGKVYCFENLGVASNVGAYRTTHHPYKLNFQFSSLVQRLSNFQILRSPFAFVPISEVVGGSYDTNFLVDVIGFLTGVGQEREITNQNGTSTKLNVMELEADGHKLQCTLFGQYVDELNTFIGAGDVNNAVVIVQFAKAKTFQDKIHIQNCMNCSVLIFNPTCPESVNLRASLSDAVEILSPMPLTQFNVEPRVQPIDEFMYNTPRMTLQGLKEATSESLNVVLATVKRILNPDSYYYTACMCSKAVIPDSRMFYCEKCNKHVQKVVPRFCIKVRVIDHTDSATLVIFDKEASLILNMSCADMIQGADTVVGVGVVPPLLEGLVEKTWLFKVEAKPSHNPKFEPSYRVRKICTDDAIIKQFKDKWDAEDAKFRKNRNDLSCLSGQCDKGKDLIIEGTPVGVSQDLMLKFSSANVNLDDDDTTEVFPEVEKGSAEVQKIAAVAGEKETTTVLAEVSVTPSSSVKPPSGRRKKSAKRVSPQHEDNDEDENAPMKLLKRAVKIEKLP